MPALPAVPHTLKLSYTISGTGIKSAAFHTYWDYTGPSPTAAQGPAIASALSSAWNTGLAPLHSALVSLIQTQVTDLSSPNGINAIDTTTHPGTISGGQNDGSTAVLINFKVARRYRGGKPRVYLPAGVAANLVNPGAWSPAYIGAVGTNWTAFVAAVKAVSWTGATIDAQVNVSYYQGFTVVTNPITGRSKNVSKIRPTPLVDTVTAFTVNPIPGNQRRRLHE